MEFIETSLAIIKIIFPIILVGVMYSVISNKDNMNWEIRINLAFNFAYLFFIYWLCVGNWVNFAPYYWMEIVLHIIFYVMYAFSFKMLNWRPSKELLLALENDDFLENFIEKNSVRKKVKLGWAVLCFIGFITVMIVTTFILVNFIDRDKAVAIMALITVIPIVLIYILAPFFLSYVIKLIRLRHLWNTLDVAPKNKHHFINIYKRLGIRSELKKYRETNNKRKYVAINKLCEAINIDEYYGEFLTFREVLTYLFCGEKALQKLIKSKAQKNINDDQTL